MAQPVFDEHPLGEYFRDAGDDQYIIPGSSSILEQEVDTMRHLYQDPFLNDEEIEWRPQFLIQLTELLYNLATSVPTSSSPSPFIERFKYIVISSTLLGSSLPSGRILRTPTPRLPGKLDHSRSPSLEEPELLTIPITPPEPNYGALSVIAIIVAALVTAGYPLLGLLLAAAAFLMYYMKVMTDTPKTDMTPSLEALNDLIAANSIWESVVQDAFTTLENEERDNLYGPSSPSTPSSSLRVALHSSLQTTQTQCDNVRNLFSALTCPSEVSQLSGMYAPPSPLQTSFSAGSRPLSLPTRRRTSSVPTNITPLSFDKRATWNGSYTGLAQAGSPTTQVYKRQEKHRSNLSAILQVSNFASKSAPVTPSPPSPSRLNQVREDDDDATDGSDATYFTGDSDSFGAAALELQRKRRRSGLEALGSPLPSYLNTFGPETMLHNKDPQSPRSPPIPMTPPAIASSLRFTAMQSPRHPLSLSALQNALQGALASKRYACSHLLALRFTEVEDELYWENVRSVMSLLTTTFADASSRLAEALDDVENQKIEDQVPTPGAESNTIFSTPQDENLVESGQRKKRRSQSRISFAPMPSHLSRFAAHVSTINSALDDAREQMDECVSALKDLPGPHGSPQRPADSGSSAIAEEEGSEEHPAIQAYERLRRELGVALRECERGRARLMELIHPPEPVYEEDDSMDDVPALGHDHSDDSDNKPEPEETTESVHHPAGGDHNFSIASLGNGNEVVDDANPYLLLAASAEHLPPPGIEQVFEADTAAPVLFTRERSKISREERIKLMKAKRESAARGLGASSSDSSQSSPSHSALEKWGPGGEVVQELKDVIWKVGERRRKMTNGQLQTS